MKKKLLIVKLSSLGDVLHTTPLIESVASKYDVYFLTFKQNYQLVKHNPGIKKVFLLRDGWGLSDIMNNVWTLWYLLTCRADIVINLHKLYKLNLLFKLIGIRQRLGIVRPNELQSSHLTSKTEFLQTIHHIIQYCRFAKELGVGCDEYSMRYYPLSLNFDLKNYELDSSPYVVCCPGGGKNKWAEMRSKRWGKDSYVDLIKMSLEKNNRLKVVLVGGAEDCELNSQIMSSINNERVVNLTNKLLFDELFYLLKASLCYIGNDSFLLHFASTTGIKTIGLFGPTSGELLSPLGKNNFYIQSKMECSPCYDANDSNNSVAYHCKKGVNCMKEISVKEVYSLLNK